MGGRVMWLHNIASPRLFNGCGFCPRVAPGVMDDVVAPPLCGMRDVAPRCGAGWLGVGVYHSSGPLCGPCNGLLM